MGEGVGYVGGIVSVVVDGMYVGFAVVKNLGLCIVEIEFVLGNF